LPTEVSLSDLWVQDQPSLRDWTRLSSFPGTSCQATLVLIPPG
jgi:hypothetical protein